VIGLPDQKEGGSPFPICVYLCSSVVELNSYGLGRPVQLVCRDDQTDAAMVPTIYSSLLDVEKVDLVIGGCQQKPAR